MLPAISRVGLVVVILKLPPALTSIVPTNRFRPVAAVIVSSTPLVPAPTVVVPVTVMAKPAKWRVQPSPTERLPPILVNVVTVVVVTVPVMMKSPAVPVMLFKTSVPLPVSLR